MSDDKKWTVKKADSPQHLAILVLTLEERGYTIKVVDTDNLVVLAEKEDQPQRLDD